MEAKENGRVQLVNGERLLSIGADRFMTKVDGQKLDIDGRRRVSHVSWITARSFHLILDGRAYEIDIRETPTRMGADGGVRFLIRVNDSEFEVDALDRLGQIRSTLSAVQHRTARRESITAPMPGLVIRVEVTEGQAISAGQGLIVLEAMKMENEIRADMDGCVERILVQPGKAVEKGEPLLSLRDPGEFDGREGPS